MWFAKLFGGGRNDESDDEPARFESPRIRLALSPHARKAAPNAKPLTASGKKGFDPYNSGAFQRQNAWEKVGRR
jgi:hypothetical protein